MWYNYTINTFDKDELIQVGGCIEANNEKEAIEKTKTLYSGMEIGYEFLELIERDRYCHPNWTRNCLRSEAEPKDWKF